MQFDISQADELLDRIEALREQIEDTYRRQGEALTSPQVLGLSQELDRLIVTYMKLER